MVSTQFGSILDAIKARKKEFVFEGEDINLVSTCGCFITMNPGYLVSQISKYTIYMIRL